jgi:hypothetical protein
MTTKGYRCRGSEAVAPHALARLSKTPIPCPQNTIMAYDMASISFPLRSKNRSRVVLGARCVPCQSDFNATHTLKSLGIWRDASGPCSISDCFRPRWGKSMFCESHLCRGWMSRNHALKPSRKVYDTSCLAQLTRPSSVDGRTSQHFRRSSTALRKLLKANSWIVACMPGRRVGPNVWPPYGGGILRI